MNEMWPLDAATILQLCFRSLGAPVEPFIIFVESNRSAASAEELYESHARQTGLMAVVRRPTPFPEPEHSCPF
jgi:hypothetical protein